MKKVSVFMAILYSSLELFAQNIQVDTTYFTNKFDKNGLIVNCLTDNCLYVFATGTRSNYDFEKLTFQYSNEIVRKPDDYFIKYNYLKSEYGIFSLLGKGIIIFNAKNLVNEMYSDLSDYTSYSYFVWEKYKEQGQYEKLNDPLAGVGEGKYGQVFIYDACVKNIESSSYLKENTKKGFMEYKCENTLEKLFYMSTPDYEHVMYDSLTPPWVEGVPGYGIGEYLDIEFKYESDEMQILNGFVDFTRMDLYSKNSRVKTLLIESENPKFNKEYELEDIVKYNVINLPAKTKKVRMTIKDVYKGDKYDDTCISSILVTNPNLPSYEEMSEKLLKAIKEAGIEIE